MCSKKKNERTRIDVDKDNRRAKSLECSAVFAYNHVQTSLANGVGVTYGGFSQQWAQCHQPWGMMGFIRGDLLRNGTWAERVREPISVVR